MKKNLLFAEVIGWYGAFAILIAYALNTLLIVTADSLVYQLLNLTGSFGLLAIAFVKKVYQSVLINGIWILIAVIGLINIIIN
ncbi:hypothetical protein JXB41_00450 [Candidatus Woesearchaeota archaeon]|nr:hypothetical protein [Candidatus Woesearchaeota archaeon]